MAQRRLLLGALTAVCLIAPARLFAQCAEVLYPITTRIIESSEEAKNTYEHWLCTTEFATHEEAHNAGISLGAVVYGVPLQATGTFTKQQRDTWKRTHCESTTQTSESAKRYREFLTYVPPEAYQAWSDCRKSNAYGVVCWLDAPPNDKKTVTYGAKWHPVPGDRGAVPKVTSSSLIGAKTGSGGTTLLANQTDVSKDPTVALVRDECASVSAVINTNRGSCPAYASGLPPVFETVYDDHNAAGQPYVKVDVRDKNVSYTQPPVPAGDGGHELKVQLSAEGPITSFIFTDDHGGGCGWTHESAKQINGNTATWTGWSNSGAPCKLIFTINFKMPRQNCIQCCGDYEAAAGHKLKRK